MQDETELTDSCLARSIYSSSQTSTQEQKGTVLNFCPKPNFTKHIPPWTSRGISSSHRNIPSHTMIIKHCGDISFRGIHRGARTDNKRIIHVHHDAHFVLSSASEEEAGFMLGGCKTMLQHRTAQLCKPCAGCRLRPYNALCRLQTLLPSSGGSLMYISSETSPLRNAVLTSSWSTSRCREEATAIRTLGVTCCAVGANTSS